MREFERKKSLLDGHVYRITAIRSDIAVLRSVEDGELLLESVYNLNTFYRDEHYADEG